VEREREIEKFKSSSSYKITALFDVEGKSLTGRAAQKIRYPRRGRRISKKMPGCQTFPLNPLKPSQPRKARLPPFTTSTLQQEASRKAVFFRGPDHEYCPEAI
jgi:DNA topoisomerase I